MRFLPGALSVLLLGCSSLGAIDPSPGAVESGDYTLALSACEAVPGRGLDICRVKEGTPITSVWRMIVPTGKNQFLGGEVTVYFKDVSNSYSITLDSPVIEIPWKVFFKDDVWRSEYDGEALALAQIRWKTPLGVEEIVKARGIAKLVVTKPGYSVMPIDSGFKAWQTTCKIQYSSAGRSAVECR